MIKRLIVLIASIFMQDSLFANEYSSRDLNSISYDMVQISIFDKKDAFLHTSKVDTKIAILLDKLNQRPNDLLLIKQISASGESLTSHVKQRLAEKPEKQELELLMLALSLIDSPQSTQMFFNIGRQYIYNEDIMYQFLRLLRDYGDTEEVNVFYKELIEFYEHNNIMLQAILLNMAISKPSSSMRWAGVYRAPGYNDQVQFAGLYLSSVITADKMVEQWILKLLTADKLPPRYQHYYLLIALSRQMSDAYFHDFVSRMPIDKSIIDSVLKERKFYNGHYGVKNQLVESLLQSQFPDQQNLAITFLLQHKGFHETWAKLGEKQKTSAIRLSHKYMIPVLNTEDMDMKIYNKDSPDNNIKGHMNYPYWYFVIFASVLILFIYGLLRYREK